MEGEGSLEDRGAQGNEVEEELFEALAGDGAWYDAKLLGLLEARPGQDGNSKHRVRVEYQNCNQVVAEVVPWQHIRRRSQAFRIGQVPECGSMVLAFQQRKSYDLYYDADVMQVKVEGDKDPQMLVQYLHGPEEGMQEWLPFHSLHCVRQQSLTFNQLKALLSSSISVSRDAATPVGCTQTPSRGAVSRVRRGAGEEGGGAWALWAGGTPRGSGGSGASARKPAVLKGPPYLCCVCSKAFNHPPAHSSHERAHLLRIRSQKHGRGARVLEEPMVEDAPTCMQIEGEHVREKSAEETGAGDIVSKETYNSVKRDQAAADTGSLVANGGKGKGGEITPHGVAGSGDVEMRNGSSDDGLNGGKGAEETQVEGKGSAEKEKRGVNVETRQMNLDMRQILLTWKTADEEHIKEFKRRLREKHPHVSQDAKMCSDTQLLVDCSGIIRDKVVIDDNGDPTLRECSEKERAITLKILRSQEHTRKMAARELDRARKEYTRFHLPLTLEGVRELGHAMRAITPLPTTDRRPGQGRVQRLHTFSSAGGRWWAPTLDCLLDLSTHAVTQRPAGAQSHSGQVCSHVCVPRVCSLPTQRSERNVAPPSHCCRLLPFIRITRIRAESGRRLCRAPPLTGCSRRQGPIATSHGAGPFSEAQARCPPHMPKQPLRTPDVPLLHFQKGFATPALPTRAGVLCPGGLKLNGLKVYVNGTGVNSEVRSKGVLVKPPGEKVLRVRVGNEVKSLSEFCESAGNTVRRVQQCIMVAEKEPVRSLAEWIEEQCRSLSSMPRAGGPQSLAKAYPSSVDRRVRGMRVPLEASDTAEKEEAWLSRGFTTTGSQYVGVKIVLLLPESESPPGAADAGGTTGKESLVAAADGVESSGGDTEQVQATKKKLRIIKGTGIQYFLIFLASSCMVAAQAR